VDEGEGLGGQPAVGEGLRVSRYACLRPEKFRSYPAVYQYKWFKVLDRHPDPSVTTPLQPVIKDAQAGPQRLPAGRAQ